MKIVNVQSVFFFVAIYVGSFVIADNFCTNNLNCMKVDRFRSLDGSCNNVFKSWIGMKGTPLKRLLPAIYGDKNGAIRSKSIDGSNLTNPRIISMKVHFPLEKPGPITLFAVFFGQLITHDIVFSATSDIDCSVDSNNTECINIPIPEDDILNQDEPFIATGRTIGVNLDWNCAKATREQVNQLTHWLDLSVIYGSDTDTCGSLRTKKDGLLLSSKINDFKHEFLPKAQLGTCNNETENRACFMSGESRVNENFVLTSIQTLFVREHNRIAKQLKTKNPSLNDEQLFQETRRIVIAEYQHIIFNEWLPLIVGTESMKRYGLNPLKTGFSAPYNPISNTQIFNEFSTAAFRFGHSMVKSTYLKKNRKYETVKNVSLNEITFNPTEAYQDEGLDGICRGSFTEQANLCDNFFTDSIQNHLFEGIETITKRRSVSALSIQRGRDHGLPPYLKYRELCNLPKAKKFEDLKEIPADVIVRLKEVYKSVDDIDLYTGGVSELPLANAAVGPTFACIISKQFRELKFGDRYYYEFEAHTALSLDELNEIRKATMARIICDNLDVLSVPKSPFLPINNSTNKHVNCSSLASINFSKITLGRDNRIININSNSNFNLRIN